MVIVHQRLPVNQITNFIYVTVSMDIINDITIISIYLHLLKPFSNQSPLQLFKIFF